MPAPRVFESCPPLSTAKIAAFEEKIGAKLPDAYRDFLLAHNGGRAEPESFMRYGEPYSRVNLFFGIGGKDRMFDLRTQWRKTRDIMPAAVLPIALDLGGNKICLAVKGKNRGKVYFWDHEGAPEDDDIRAEFPEFYLDVEDEYQPPPPPDWPGHPDLTLIADSFDEFLQSFYELEEEEPVAKPRARKATAKKAATKKAVAKKTATKKRTPSAAKPRKKR